MQILKGIGVYEGIVLGTPYLTKKKKEKISVYKIGIDMVEDEIAKFHEAVDDTKQEIKVLIDSLFGKVDQNDIKILNVHMMMLEDPVFISDITNKIRVEMVNVEAVVESVVEKYSGMFKSLNDPVYRQRAIDVEDVGEKLILNLQGKKVSKEDLDGKILISMDLKPSELLRYHNEGIKVAGIATEVGGETSHIAILAKSLGIPTIMAIEDLVKIDWDRVKRIIIDSRKDRQEVIINPEKNIIEWYTKEIHDLEMEEEELSRLIGIPAFTADGKRVNLYANIGGVKDLEEISKYKPDGIGLLRTEFLYMDSSYFPTENEQFKAYKAIAEGVGENRPVIVRTLDIGADKKLSYFDLPEEENPALGLRAFRLCMANKNIFKTQIRAILRASAFGNIKMMYPMISGTDEMEEARKIVEEAMAELDDEGIKYNKDIEIGIMVEVPSAAIMADILVKEADFFSIGTNDLTQYVMAADRLSKDVAHIYDNFNPAVLRLINYIADVCSKEGKKVSICGEMGGDTLAVIAFVSFGITELSMLPLFVPKIKKIINKINTNDLKKIKDGILKAKNGVEVKKILNEYLLGVM